MSSLAGPLVASAAGIVCVGLVFFTLSESILRQLDRLPGPAVADPVVLPDRLPATARGTPRAAGFDAPPRADRAEAPNPRESPRATLADVSAAMTAFGPAALELLAAGRQELAELASRPVRDATARQIAARRRAQWARVWRARVARLLAPLPPAEGCRRHALLAEACLEMRAISGDLAKAASAAESSIDDALEMLDAAELRLNELLAPDEPESATSDGAPPNDDAATAPAGSSRAEATRL